MNKIIAWSKNILWLIILITCFYELNLIVVLENSEMVALSKTISSMLLATMVIFMSTISMKYPFGGVKDGYQKAIIVTIVSMSIISLHYLNQDMLHRSMLVPIMDKGVIKVHRSKRHRYSFKTKNAPDYKKAYKAYQEEMNKFWFMNNVDKEYL